MESITLEELEKCVTAYEAAQILSQRYGYTVISSSISKMVKRKWSRIRFKKLGHRNYYYREDIEAIGNV